MYEWQTLRLARHRSRSLPVARTHLRRMSLRGTAYGQANTALVQCDAQIQKSARSRTIKMAEIASGSPVV